MAGRTYFKYHTSINTSTLCAMRFPKMQENVYIAQKKRIIRQSFFIWLFVFGQIVLNCFIIPSFINGTQTWAILFINLILSAITIPGVVLFFKYYKLSVDKTFVVTYDSLKFIDDKTKSITELLNSDIVKIHLVQNSRLSLSPWSFHEYFSLTDNSANKIIITSYIMELSDFWLDPLTKKINSKNLTREEKAYPII